MICGGNKRNFYRAHYCPAGTLDLQIAVPFYMQRIQSARNAAQHWQKQIWASMQPLENMLHYQCSGFIGFTIIVCASLHQHATSHSLRPSTRQSCMACSRPSKQGWLHHHAILSVVLVARSTIPVGRLVAGPGLRIHCGDSCCRSRLGRRHTEILTDCHTYHTPHIHSRVHIANRTPSPQPRRPPRVLRTRRGEGGWTGGHGLI